MEEVKSQDWIEKVYKPDIKGNMDKLWMRMSCDSISPNRAIHNGLAQVHLASHRENGRGLRYYALRPGRTVFDLAQGSAATASCECGLNA
jgi:hypothetical protein